MNKKAGLYIGAIALAAMALIATISFNSISGAGAQESRSQAKAILDLKWEMQNSQFVAGKAIADAVADASYTPTSCGYNSTLATSKIGTYLTAVKNQAFPNCSFNNVLSISMPGNNVTVSLTLRCEKDSGSLNGTYEKGIQFKKQVQTSMAGNQCTVVVNNTDGTAYEEVRQTKTFTP